MWAFFSSMTNKIILEFQRRRHHSNPFQIVFFNSHEHCCISIQSYKKLSWDREYNFELHWISILKSILLKSQPGGEMASSSRGFPTERLDARLGRFSREDSSTFTFSTVNFPNGAPGFSREEQSASNFHFFLTKTKPKRWILLVFQTVALLSVAWLALTISTAVICFILRFLLLLVLRSSSKKIILPIYTQRVPFKRGAHRILYLREAPC